MGDPRKANTLDEAAKNPDGTYNGAKAFAWITDVLTGGKGLSEAEVTEIWNKEKAARAAGERQRCAVCGELIGHRFSCSLNQPIRP